MSQLYHFEELTSKDKRFVRACGIRTPNPDRRGLKKAPASVDPVMVIIGAVASGILVLAIIGVVAILDGRIF